MGEETPEVHKLAILSLINKAFVNIFDGNYTDCIENFKTVLDYKVGNPTVQGNIDVVSIFLN